MGLRACLFPENIVRWCNLECILIRFASENSRIFHLLHKNNDIVAKPLLGGVKEEIRWCILEYILLKLDLNNVIVARCNLLCLFSNFDEILLNNNIQKRIIFIQNKDIAAAGLLGYSYGELLPRVLTTSCLSTTSKLLHFVGLPQVYSKLTNSRRPAFKPPPPPPPTGLLH